MRIWDPATGDSGRPGGHIGWFAAVCAVTVDGRQLLASAGDDQTVRIWDPVTGSSAPSWKATPDWVRAVCAVTVDGRPLLASAGDDRRCGSGTGTQGRFC